MRVEDEAATQPSAVAQRRRSRRRAVVLDPPGKRLSTPKESSARPRPIGRTTMHPSPSSTLTLVPASILNRRRSSTGMTIWPLGVAVDTDILGFRFPCNIINRITPDHGALVPRERDAVRVTAARRRARYLTNCSIRESTKADKCHRRTGRPPAGRARLRVARARFEARGARPFERSRRLRRSSSACSCARVRYRPRRISARPLSMPRSSRRLGPALGRR